MNEINRLKPTIPERNIEPDLDDTMPLTEATTVDLDAQDSEMREALRDMPTVPSERELVEAEYEDTDATSSEETV